MRKDQTDCTNSDSPNVDSLLVGNIWVTRLHDGNTSVEIAVTVKPSTNYKFFLRCVPTRRDRHRRGGGGQRTFVFPTDLVGTVYALALPPHQD
jgi:hypothetical protein